MKVRWRGPALATAALGLVAALGCSGDVNKLLTSNPEMQSQIMGAISADSALAGRMIDQLMTKDGTRTLLMEKVFANGQAKQDVMSAVARDQTMIDGVLNLAVQDSSMRNHVMTLFKGVQMGQSVPR
jgi:hypothetical protein